MNERLFFALWPDDAVRERLQTEIMPLVDPRATVPQRPDQWHVTLVFLGQVGTERKGVAMRCAAGVRSAPFIVDFDAIEYWRRPRVLSMTAGTTPAPLVAVVQDLRVALIESGFEIDEREFRPHVTLARKVNAGIDFKLALPLAWPVRRFALVSSVTDRAGSRYEPLQWWNLTHAES